jgi:hypothetical protein
MFVNQLRQKFPGFEVFNLAHRGYGTDQALLTFQQWHAPSPLKFVFLMFSENDVIENNRVFQYDKYKPRFDVVGGRLVLGNVPVPRTSGWEQPTRDTTAIEEMESLKRLLFRSHLLHDLSFRWYLAIQDTGPSKPRAGDTFEADDVHDLIRTQAILKALKAEVSERGGELVVIAIPSKKQFVLRAHQPHQTWLGPFLRTLDVAYFDLGPDFQQARFRAYHRIGTHWNAYGNTVAAESIYRYLKETRRL